MPELAEVWMLLRKTAAFPAVIMCREQRLSKAHRGFLARLEAEPVWTVWNPMRQDQVQSREVHRYLEEKKHFTRLTGESCQMMVSTAQDREIQRLFRKQARMK